MRLKSFSVSEFRSIIASGEITLGDVTCLVGKNEAGKTALLKALYKLSPMSTTDARFDVTDDYPRKDLGDYQHEVDEGVRGQAVPIRATFELTDAEVSSVANLFGPKALTSNVLTLEKSYDNRRVYSLDFNETEALKYVVSSAELESADLAAVGDVQTWKGLGNRLAELAASPTGAKLKMLVDKINDKGSGGGYYAYNSILSRSVPEFLYFDEYYQMVGHDNVEALIQRRDSEDLRPSDHPLLGLINLARLSLDDLISSKRTMEMVNKLEAAGNHLTRQILKYWSQNKHLQMKFDVREAMADDPVEMRSGHNIWGRVYDQVHWATTELSSRSRGFVWFFSFLAWYEDVKRARKNIILLLDEPGTSLHGRAQGDLLRYIEQELRPHHQVIYTTHSPFMVDPQHFDRVRIVQDRGIDSDDPLPREEDGTKVLENVFDASDDSLFPLQGALGYDISQTLFIGPNSLVVEGPSDLFYLRGMSSLLEREKRTGLSPEWTLTPVGGSSKIPTFVAMLAPQRGMNVAVLVDIQASDRQTVEGLYKKKLLDQKNVHTFADFTGLVESDVEDMFERDFYVNLVNEEFRGQLSSKITASKLNRNLPRVLRALEEHFQTSPLKSGQFGHYRPARYFAENLAVLTPKISEETKNRFEALFKKLNAQL
ncbi:conserved hypothetical protein [Rhizobium leguminosarum bv. trifolii WSM1325]|uniref:Endonuclease GajA/Old nuclease/RecF-like AAA domain-containing protein n=1 Tax=Rhizobium leguminosarum bv. trifolii (strain WSM1325) TaxID=395491 RepID=C6B088_RHILS|nr:AAA family ATPase [Rhizobium leguminosarum]ACS54507.1 conserved hypothetical protein [Rhizobium leguminosarum bv. trifolii WSM1325]